MHAERCLCYTLLHVAWILFIYAAEHGSRRCSGVHPSGNLGLGLRFRITVSIRVSVWAVVIVKAKIALEQPISNAAALGLLRFNVAFCSLCTCLSAYYYRTTGCPLHFFSLLKELICSEPDQKISLTKVCFNFSYGAKIHGNILSSGWS